jgi:hypothetical protein
MIVIIKVCIDKIFISAERPNIVVEWLTFLLRIWDVPGSILGLETGYPN